MLKLITITSLLVLATTPSLSQSYNMSYGDSRVIIGGNGLANPSGTYIGGGTISPSARGQLQSGPQVNRNIPSVSWGSHIGTAGDNQYGAAPIINNAAEPRRQQQRMSNGLPSSKWGANVGTAGDTMRSDLHPDFYRSNQKQAPIWTTPKDAQFQQVLKTSGNGPLRYDSTTSGKVSY